MAPEPAQVVGIGQRGSLHAEIRASLARLGGGEELRLQPLEITFGLHALQQDGAHHAAPANESDSLDRHNPQSVTDVGAKVIGPPELLPRGK